MSQFKLLMQSSFLWLRRLNFIASLNKIDLNIDFGWFYFPFMNCLPSPMGLTKCLVTMPKWSSVVMQWLSSRNSTSPFWSAVQAYRNISSKPLLANAEVSACCMFSFDDSDVAIQIMSSINLWKSAASCSTSVISCRM